MRRDLDLLRSILFEVEQRGQPNELVDPHVEGRNELEISYHIMLLEDAGLIRALDRSAIGVYRWSAAELTWLGHETVELMRDDTLWSQAKHDVLEAAGGGQPFESVRGHLAALIERRLG